MTNRKKKLDQATDRKKKLDQATDRLVDHFLKKVGEGHKPQDTLDSMFDQLKTQYPTILVALVQQ